MQGKSQQELYQSFLDFIANDVQRERHQVNRRMMSVFFWCFFIPTASSISVLILVKLHVLPKNARNHLDWLVLILPVCYSLYVLSSEVLSHIPAIFRRGGGANSLEQSRREGEWRERISESMEKFVGA